MGLEEIIGFIISLLAILFLIGRSIFSEIYKRQYPQKYTEENERKNSILQNFLQSMNLDEVKEPKTGKKSYNIENEYDDEEEEEEKKVIPLSKFPIIPPKPAQYHSQKEVFQKKDYKTISSQTKTKIEERYQKDITHASNIHMDHSKAYDIIQETNGVSKGKKTLDRLKNRQDMIIVYEIFKQPKWKE
jgi:hypothetical protein